MTFKINAKQFLITYPKCTLSKDEVLTHLQSVKKLVSYTISKELHADGTPHIHACVVFSEKVHTTNVRVFDILAFHPNIETLRKRADVDRATTYTKKDGDFITNVTQSPGKRAMLAEALIAEGRITKKFIIENPEVIFLNHSSISSWLNYLRKPISVQPPSTKRRHVWLSGPSNTGKTTWLRAYLSMFDYALELPDNQDHRDIDESTQVIYADEYRGQFTVQHLNKLCDGNTQLNTKGSSTRIAYPTIVVVSNFSIRETYPKISDTIYETLCNRFCQYDSSYKLPPFPKSIIIK